MNRHMRCIGDQPALSIEDRTREIEALFDIDRIGSVLQRYAHLFGDCHEQIVEDFQQDRIAGGAHCQSFGQSFDALHEHMIVPAHLKAPVGLHHDGRGRIRDNGRTLDDIAWFEMFSSIDRRFKGLPAADAALRW